MKQVGPARSNGSDGEATRSAGVSGDGRSASSGNFGEPFPAAIPTFEASFLTGRPTLILSSDYQLYLLLTEQRLLERHLRPLRSHSHQPRFGAEASRGHRTSTMARNQEKAQSMLYRFREAQANSLGLSSSTSKPLRRPRLASSVTSLKECEKWRAEVIREISRKVSKIQDYGLTDYEVRDLNDEINKLLREKGHWENQISALGGANYKRAVPSMLGGADGGLAGKGGYRYFGRAKDLPGVKELFTAKTGEEEKRRDERWERFNGLPPSYYGDMDEDDGVLLEEEARQEEVEWNEAFWSVVHGLKQDLREREEMDVSDAEDDAAMGGVEVPKIPRVSPKALKESMQAIHASFDSAYQSGDATAQADAAESSHKRPQDEDDVQTDAKRQKGEAGHAVVAAHAPEAQVEATPVPASPAPTAPAPVGYSIFSAADLQSPSVPDRAAIEKLILQAKKKQLRQEYIGA